MRLLITSLALIAFVIMTAFTGKKSIIVTSYAFTNNGYIPVKYTCLGQGASPPLTFSNIPAEARSLAIIVDDPDYSYTCKADPPKAGKRKSKKTANSKVVQSKMVQKDSCFVDWVIWNIDTGSFIPENFKNFNEGLNGLKQPGYTGICPSAGPHHYHFKVYALDIKLNLSKNGSKAELEKLMEGHVVGWGEIVGVFDKNYR
jgi:Raf kinase inhibitor-like YbhB/YbcL family protein